MAKRGQTKESKDTSEPLAPNPHGRWARLAFTIAPFCAYLFAERIPLPGIDAVFLDRAEYSPEMYSIVALGITPWITAALLVEIAAVAIPRWRHLRHGGVVGRAKLQQATNILGLICAAIQACLMVQWLQLSSDTSRGGIGPILLMFSTLVAGTILTRLLAEVVTHRGLANGYGVFLVGSISLATARTIFNEKLMLGWMDVIGVSGKIVACAALTWFVLTRLRPARGVVKPEKRINAHPDDTDPHNPYTAPKESGSSQRTDAPHAEPVVWQLPTPASGLLPHSIVISLLVAPAMFHDSIPGVAALKELLRSENTLGLVSLSLLVACTWVCTWLFNQPKRVAKVYARVSKSNASEARITGEVQEASRHAFAHALFFLFGLMVIDLATTRVTNVALGMENVAFAVVVFLDIAKEFRTLASRRDLVSVWSEQRPYALAAAQRALESEGVFMHVRDEHQKRLFQFTVPYIPMEIFVPHRDAHRATNILNGVLLETREKPEPRSDDLPVIATRRPLQTWVVALIALFSVGTVGLSWPSAKFTATHAPRTTKLEFVLVDDENSIADNATDSFPQREHFIKLESEQVSIGPGKTAISKYARVEKDEGETLEAARSRLEAWLKVIKLPEGDRVAIGEYQTYDEELGKSVVSGWRTYLLKGAAILTEADVATANVVPDRGNDLGGWGVLLQFTTDGAQRFAKVTGDNIKRRFAILIDDRVQSAPIIQSKIPGGNATITMGNANNEEQQRTDAQNLVRALHGK